MAKRPPKDGPTKLRPDVAETAYHQVGRVALDELNGFPNGGDSQSGGELA